MNRTYTAEYCEWAKEFLSQGRSMVALSAHLQIVKSTLYKWCEDHPEFAEAVELGRAAGQAWLEEEGRKSIWANKDFNNVYYLYTMKSQYRVSENEAAQSQTNVYISDSKVKEFIDKVVPQEHPI